MKTPYPIDRSNDRRLSESYSGTVLIWDIDKTYLNTRFSTWRGLLAIPFEFAIDKRPIAGAVELLRGLRHGPDKNSRLTPLYFVSASPPELRHVIERRMVLDGVQNDGITFKDQLYLLRHLQLGMLKRQVGYKLVALLRYARELPTQSRYFLFGDDAEDDARIFSLFGEILDGLRADPLSRRLVAMGANERECGEIVQLASDMVSTQNVGGIFIHRIRGRNIDYLARYEGRVIATDGFFEQALLLLARGEINVAHTARVGRALLARDHDDQSLAEHLATLRERHHLDEKLIDAVRLAL